MWALMQVLDDSTDQVTRELVDDKCLEWAERGVACECVRRTHRSGYKAGALKEVSCCPFTTRNACCSL
jgi:beta-mannan synthase